MFHVDAHAKKTSVEREYNTEVDRLTAIAEVECSTPISEKTLALGSMDPPKDRTRWFRCYAQVGTGQRDKCSYV